MKVFQIFIVLFLFESCADRNECTIFNKSNDKFTHIRDNLYFDDTGNFYIKSVNNEVGVEKGNKSDVYLKTVYCDTCWTATKDGWTDITELKDFVDSSTFHLFKTDLKQGGDFYKDKNHTYFHKWMADGGTITVY